MIPVHNKEKMLISWEFEDDPDDGITEDRKHNDPGRLLDQYFEVISYRWLDTIEYKTELDSGTSKM